MSVFYEAYILLLNTERRSSCESEKNLWHCSTTRAYRRGYYWRSTEKLLKNQKSIHLQLILAAGISGKSKCTWKILLVSKYSIKNLLGVLETINEK